MLTLEVLKSALVICFSNTCVGESFDIHQNIKIMMLYFLSILNTKSADIYKVHNYRRSGLPFTFRNGTHY